MLFCARGAEMKSRKAMEMKVLIMLLLAAALILFAIFFATGLREQAKNLIASFINIF